jgi:putative membrane protein
MKDLAPKVLLAAYLAVFAVCAVSPYDRAVWWAENLPIMLLVLALIIGYRFYRFTALSYVMMFFLIIMHTVGGHFTFERVPFGFVTDLFGFTRNLYDRVAHFTVGFYAYPLAELLLRKRLVSSRWILFLFPLFTIVAVAGLYEIFEWLYAVSADETAGIAVLGSQGDTWDAQKDMLADSLGAVFALALFSVLNRARIRTLSQL